MLTVTGTAEFTDNGRTLSVRIAVQPHVPHEHNLLANVATLNGLDMDHGQLILTGELFGLPHDLLKDLEQTPSNPPSDATSVSDDSE